MGFQGSVNQYLSPAVAGDFASANPRASYLSGEGALIVGEGGVIVGNFAWVDSDNVLAVSNGSATAPAGFVANEHQGVIVGLTNEASMVVPQGLPVTLYNGGDFWATTHSTTTIDQKVYAMFADGSIVTAATATPPVAASVTADTGGVFTGAISGTTLTISAVTSGHLRVGDLVTGPGGSSDPIAANTYITALGTGTGGTGTYTVNNSQTSTSATVTAVGTTMTVTAVGSGALSVGEPITGTGVTAGTYIVSQLTGSAGSTGTYTISTAQRFVSTTVTATGGVETKFYAASAGSTGNLIKITSTPPTGAV